MKLWYESLLVGWEQYTCRSRGTTLVSSPHRTSWWASSMARIRVVPGMICWGQPSRRQGDFHKTISTWSWHSTNEDEGRLAIIFKQCSILRLQGLNSVVLYNILGVPYRRDHTRLLTHALGLWTVHHCLVGRAYTINIVKKPLSCDLVISYPCTSGRIWAGPSLLWGGFSSNFLSTTSPC